MTTVAIGALLLVLSAGAARDHRPPTAPKVSGLRTSATTNPTYTFSATDRGTPARELRFRCSFDTTRLHGCARRYSPRLRVGDHLLRARALDPAGNLSRLARVRVHVTTPPPPSPPPAPPPPPNVILGIASSGSGAVQLDSPPGARCSSTCSYTYERGAIVNLLADAVEGSYFAGWSGGCSGSTPTCSLTLNADASVVASFQPWSFTLSVTIEGAGSVASRDGQIACPTTCAANYGFGAYVTLAATPDGGHVFVGWSGDYCSDTSNPCTVPMFGSTSVTATFS